VSLHHVDLGGAGRPPLVILHGLLGSSRNWQTAGRGLAAHFHVFALDARNHGRSPHHAAMDYPAMAADVLAWLEARDMTSVTLLGHSMGGKTAMLLACRHPEKVGRLVVVDIASKNYQWAEHRSEFAAMNELELAGLSSRGEAEQRFESRVPDLGLRKFLVTNIERDGNGPWRWVINLPVLTGALPAMERDSLVAGDRFAGPALFLAGGRSRYVLPADHARIQSHFPAARIEVIAEAGHNPHLDRRDEFVRRVVEFAGAGSGG
jgi:pimeloyl-ACP methyl ester carboxylesterase